MGSLLRVLAPLVLILAFLPTPALAGCTPTGPNPDVDGVFLAGVTGRHFYVDNDLCQPF